MKGSNKRKSFVKPVGMNDSSFINEALFLSLRLSLRSKMDEMAQTFISEIEWLAVLKCRATGLSASFAPYGTKVLSKSVR